MQKVVKEEGDWKTSSSPLKKKKESTSNYIKSYQISSRTALAVGRSAINNRRHVKFILSFLLLLASIAPTLAGTSAEGLAYLE